MLFWNFSLAITARMPTVCGLLFGHFDADGALAGDRRDDADAQRGEAQRDVVLQVLDLADAHARLRDDLVERHRRSDRRLDLVDADVVVGEGLDDAVLVLLQFLLGHGEVAVAVVNEQVDVRQLVAAQVQRRIVLAELLQLPFDLVVAQRLFFLAALSRSSHRHWWSHRLPTA